MEVKIMKKALLSLMILSMLFLCGCDETRTFVVKNATSKKVQDVIAKYVLKKGFVLEDAK